MRPTARGIGTVLGSVALGTTGYLSGYLNSRNTKAPTSRDADRGLLRC